MNLEPMPSNLEDLSSYVWALDGHVWAGKIVAGILVRKKKIESAEWLSWAQFVSESGVVSPAKDSEYLRDWDLQIQEKFPGQTLETMTAAWEAIKNDVFGCTRWLLGQRGLL